MNEIFIKRHPLLAMLIAVSIALLLCIISAVLWFYSDADLERVRVAAKEMGVELDENKLRGPVSEQYLLDAMDRLTALSESKNLVFGESAYYDGLDHSIEYPSFSTDGLLKRDESIPQYLYEFYQNHMNTFAHDEIMKCIEQLKGHQLEKGDHLNYMTSLPHIMGMQHVFNHLCEWMLTLSKEEFQRELTSAFVLLESLPKSSLIECLVKTAISGLLVETAFLRIDDMPIKLVKQLDVLCESLEGDIRYSMKLECVFLMNSLVDSNADELIHLDFSRRFGRWEEAQNNIINRWLRERELMILLDIAQQAQLDYASFRVFMLSVDLRNRTRENKFLPATVSAMQSVDSAVCRIQVLRSIITKTPMPNDAFGNPLKEIHDTTGKLLGYYSIGEDGIDAGWDKEEGQPIWIYGELD